MEYSCKNAHFRLVFTIMDISTYNYQRNKIFTPIVSSINFNKFG